MYSYNNIFGILHNFNNGERYVMEKEFITLQQGNWIINFMLLMCILLMC